MPTPIGHDVNGKPIYDADEAPVTKNADPGQGIGGVIDRILPMLVASEGTSLGASAGSALGPVGTIAGGALGGLASFLLAHKGINALGGTIFGGGNKSAGELGPDQFQPNLTMDDLKEAGINQAFESGIPLALQGIGKGVNFLKDNPALRTLLHIAPQQNDVRDIAALAQTPELSRSVGDVTGSKPLQKLEAHLGKQPLVDLRNTQKVEQQAILDKLRGTDNVVMGPTNPAGKSVDIGQQGQQALGNAFAESKDAYTNAYNDFTDKVIKPNIQTINIVTGRTPDVASGLLDASGNPTPATPGSPIIEQHQVALPITLNGTKHYVETMGESLQKLLSPEDFQNLPDPLKRQLTSVNNVLKNAANPTEVQLANGSTQQIPFKEYDAVKEARTQLGDLLDNATGLKRKLYAGLRDAMDGDITRALNGYDPSGAANAMRDKADALFGVHHDIYDPVMKRVYQSDPSLEQYADPSAMFNDADTDPKVARQLRSAFKPVDLPMLKTGMMSQAIDAAYDPASGFTNVDQLINKITDPGSPYRSVFTPTEINNTETMLRGMRTQNPGAMQAGRSLSFIGGHIGLALTGAAAGAISGKDTTSRLTSAGLAGAAIMIAPSMFVNRVLLNPNSARIAAQLAKVAPDAPEAQLMVKLLFKTALRGVQFKVNGADGQEKSGHIGNDGQLMMDGSN